MIRDGNTQYWICRKCSNFEVPERRTCHVCGSANLVVVEPVAKITVSGQCPIQASLSIDDGKTWDKIPTEVRVVENKARESSMLHAFEGEVAAKRYSRLVFDNEGDVQGVEYSDKPEGPYSFAKTESRTYLGWLKLDVSRALVWLKLKASRAKEWVLKAIAIRIGA